MTRIGVAISTTGDEHRLELLLNSVQGWSAALPDEGDLFVTVDGDEAACQRVTRAIGREVTRIYRVGQYRPDVILPAVVRGPRMGVAVNKNTGIELLMDAGVDHLFLSDDDTWPLSEEALAEHMTLAPHSMVCWGTHRLTGVVGSSAYWNWPRGVVLYMHRSVIEIVGGMDERFGVGGHEHVEFSRRIHNADLTPAPFLSPASHAADNGFGARRHWYAADMRQPGEPLAHLKARRRALTTIHRAEGDWDHINDVMFSREGSSDFVAYRAADNGRASATLCVNNRAEEPDK